MLTTTYPNSSVQTKVYNGTTADLSSAITKTSGAVTLDSHSYTYKGDGRRLTETATSGDVITYGYDNAGQLTSEVRTGTTAYSISYTYDNAGNRATKVQGGTTDTYTYDNAEKLSSTSSKTYGYDNAGNLTSVVSGGVTTALTWDAEERLKTVSVGGTTTQTNTYNGLGQRTKKVEGSNTFTFTLNDDAIDAAVLDDGAASYIQSAAGLAGETRSGTSKYYSADALGTTRAIVNSSQTKTDSLDTDAFGMNVAVTGTTPTPFGFAGQHGYQSDSATGLMRLGHRYYDASIGRFLSRDPIQDGYNWYTYAGNDPVNDVDPEGEEDHPATAYNDTNEIKWVILVPIKGKDLPVVPGNPKKHEPPYIVAVPNGPNLPGYPVYPIDDKGKNNLVILRKSWFHFRQGGP